MKILHRATINKVLWSVYTDIVGLVSVRPASVVGRLVTEVPTTLHSVIQRLTVNTENSRGLEPHQTSTVNSTEDQKIIFIDTVDVTTT